MDDEEMGDLIDFLFFYSLIFVYFIEAYIL